ncbi:MAG TPA: RNA 2',3'-cyclic phosphodiesterase [Candidatus Limnocylindrales bacterium]
MSWDGNGGRGPGPRSGAPWRGRRPFVRPPDDPPGTSRLFVAVPVSDEVRTAVGELMEKVAGAPITERAFGQPRWVRVEGLHLTLRFLGATPDERQPALTDALREVAAAAAPFEVTLSGGGSFPNPTHPRVLWIGIAEGDGELIELAGRLNERLAPLGWPPEGRPLAPHLTLARTDGVPGADERARQLVEVASDVRLSWQADRIVLYKSVVGRGPTRYEVVSEALL